MIPHHTVTGPRDAPVLVLSNSLGTTFGMWDPQAEALARRFRLVRYDTRGHGGSDVPAGPYAIEDLGQDVIELLDELEVARAHVAGLSLGGMTAMWLAINAPERVERLVLLSTSPRLGPPEGWADRAATVRKDGTAAIADATMARWLTADYRARHDLQRGARDVRRHRRRGLCELLPRDRAHGPGAEPRRRQCQDARDRRRPRPGHAARPARPDDRRGHPRRRGWRSSTRARTCSTSSAPTT